MKKRVLTGDRPTGKLHLGHYIGSLENRVKLQDDYDSYIMVADVQALTTHFEEPALLREHIYQVLLDYFAVGIDPERATVFLQSLIPEIAELTIFYSMFVTVNSLRHNPTTKQEIEEKGLQELYYGFLGYPISQAADITIFKAHCVPVGADQIPHIEQARKIARRFNELYQPVFVEPEALLSSVSGKLMGLDGKAKMSKSLNNCIYISDGEEQISLKIRKAVTDPARIRKTDKGHPEICVVFAYHKIFNALMAPEIKDDCENACIGCTECKKRLVAKLTELLLPMQEQRKRYEENPKLVWDILHSGTEKAKKVAQETIGEVREAMGLVTFNR